MRSAAGTVRLAPEDAPNTLRRAEFFGETVCAHSAGHTGAERTRRAGKFSVAGGGTLFLDEIGEMALALQASAIRAALAVTGGNKVAVARQLGIARATWFETLPAEDR